MSLGIRPDLISSGFQVMFNLKYFFMGVVFNFAGSFFWAYGRSKLNSYALAWNSYLLLLVVFGVLISCFLGKDKLAINQYLGIGLGIMAIYMISKP